MKYLYAEAWSRGGKIDWRWWALQSHFSLSRSDRRTPARPDIPPRRSLRQNAADLLSRTDASFMTLLLFYHGNSFESIYQSAGTIKHVDLKDQVQVIPSIHWGALRWKVKKREKKPFPSLKHSHVSKKELGKQATLISDLPQRQSSNYCLIVRIWHKKHYTTPQSLLVLV